MIRALTKIGVVACLGFTASVATVTPANAALPGPGYACTPSLHNFVETVVNSTEVSPTLTHFISINVTEGTTGSRTETLTVLNTVTTTVNHHAEIGAEFTFLFIKIGNKVGFSVQQTASSTSQETSSMTWNFNSPGYFGLYKGTRAVAGTCQQWRCWSPPGSRGRWKEAYPSSPADFFNEPRPYTTYASLEIGTISCGDEVPPNSVRLMARLQLGC